MRVLVALALVVAACGQYPNSLPPAACPQVALPPDPLGPPSDRAGRAALRLEARSQYVSALIERMIGARFVEDPAATTGADLGTIRLLEVTDGGQRLNLLALTFSAWARGQDGSHVPLPGRTYTLQLQLRPHLITRRNTTDETTRRFYLKCDEHAPCESGVVAVLAYHRLLGGGARSATTPVDCNSADYDQIDEIVLGRALAAVAALEPIGIPLDGVMAALNSRLGLDVELAGIDVGTDQDLVIGFLLDPGASTVFDTTAWASRGDYDWALGLQTELLVPAVRERVTAIAKDKVPGIAIGAPATVAFTEFGVELSLAGTFPAGVCGQVPFSVTGVANPSVCGHAIGACPVVDAPVISPSNPAQAACIEVALLGQSILREFGKITRELTGGPAGPPPTTPSSTCAGLTSPIVYSIGSHDVVYPVAVDTDGVFVVKGRSELMDNRNPSRTPPPLTNCSW